VPTDDPKDPAPRRRKRAAATDTSEPAVESEGRKSPRARKPASEVAAKPARARRTKAAEAEPELDAAATGSGPTGSDAAATKVTPAAADLPTPAMNGGSPSAADEGAAAGSTGDAPAQDPEQGARRAKVEATLHALLERMEMPATLDVRDVPDGSFSVAVRFATLPPGVHAGRRSPFMDSLQFLTNKLLHQPRTPGRRWVTLGAMEHPPPRGPKPVKANGAAAPAEAPVERRKGREKVPGAKPAVASEPARVDERQLEVDPDPVLAEAARQLAERSAKYGRLYTVLGMGEADRARVVQAAAPVEGLRVSCEGEGRHRRVTFRPDAPAPLPKRTIPDWDDDEDVD
jgi:predicted RNA-binding protein Jag